ncbi:MAG: Gfo/Idh/MocA family oxidoreductase [Verrucomicrobiota bacterium]
MNAHLSRRDFLATTGIATLTAATLPAVLGADSDAPKPVTLALVGGAHIHTPSFIDLLKRRKDVRVKSVWDHDQARAEKRAKPLNAQVVADAGEIWSDSEVAAVVICSETNRHHDLILAAAKAGKHMFAEKPLGITAAESREMADAIEKAGLLFTTGYFMRTDPKHLFLREEIAKGSFGKITRARGSNCHSGSLGGWFDTEWRWMADPKIAGVGGFGDLGTHKLDILMWLLGDVDSATASIKVVTERYGDCDESGEGLIQFKNGTVATLAAGWVDVADPVQLIISGTQAHAAIINDRLFYKNKKVEGADGVEPFTSLPPAPAAPLMQFVNAVAGQKDQPLVTPREAAARVSVMEAMYRGAHDRAWMQPA